MRGLLIILVLVIAAGAAAFYGANYRPHFSICKEDAEIAAADRDAIDQAALAFVSAVRGDEKDAALAAMSAAGRASTNADDIDRLAAAYAMPEAQGEPKIDRTYYVRTYGWSHPGVGAPCKTATAALGGTGETAHVLISDNLGDGTRASAIWLEREAGAWRPRGIWSGIVAANGLDGESLWRQAKEQRNKRHDINAALLYASAEQLLYRGDFLNPAARHNFFADRATFAPPPEMRGAPPIKWTLGEERFQIAGVRLAGTPEGIGFDIRFQRSAWQDEASAEAAARHLIEAYNTAHPEWREIAAFISARTATPSPDHLAGAAYAPDRGFIPVPATLPPQ